ncbi:hypothetical protein ACTMU2_35120 [Cupriavidus basilensis]
MAQTEAVETGAVATLFGGSARGGVRDVQLVGVVADVADGAGAAIVSLDGGPPKAVCGPAPRCHRRFAWWRSTGAPW